jgi:beta-lactamase superfamily II metal-dependent hydrolase
MSVRSSFMCPEVLVIEVDWIWIGDGVKTGDAIACRFTRPDTGTLAIVLVDGGRPSDGERVVDFIQARYGTSYIDLVVSTHPDDDHIGGLTAVLEQMSVGVLLIHRPAQYGYGGADEVKASEVEALIQLAENQGSVVIQPFAGQRYFGNALTVAGPSEAFYLDCLPSQRGFGQSVSKAVRMLESAARNLRAKLVARSTDPGERELSDNGGTSPRNNTSVILDLRVEGTRVLFTGDAGAPALTEASERLQAWGLVDRWPDAFDIPHHGSRHNLTSDVLDSLIGPASGENYGIAVASVGAQADDYPRPEVANALKRRGYPVFTTRGSNFWWNRGAPARPDYRPVEPLPWFQE